MNARIDGAIRFVQESGPGTDVVSLLDTAKTLAKEVRRLQESVQAHRGALCAVAAIDGADGDAVIAQLDDRWPL